MSLGAPQLLEARAADRMCARQLHGQIRQRTELAQADWALVLSALTEAGSPNCHWVLHDKRRAVLLVPWDAHHELVGSISDVWGGMIEDTSWALNYSRALS